jgi:hypothetical protein
MTSARRELRELASFPFLGAIATTGEMCYGFCERVIEIEALRRTYFVQSLRNVRLVQN